LFFSIHYRKKRNAISRLCGTLSAVGDSHFRITAAPQFQKIMVRFGRDREIDGRDRDTLR